MTIPDATTIRAGVAALKKVSDNGTFKTLIALTAIAGCALLVWRTEVRADAQIEVMRAMTHEIMLLRGDFRAHNIKAARQPTVEAVERE